MHEDNVVNQAALTASHVYFTYDDISNKDAASVNDKAFTSSHAAPVNTEAVTPTNALAAHANLARDIDLGCEFALRDVSCSIAKGTYTAIIGPNGSGKSTLARHFNALLLPNFGKVTSFGIDSQTDSDLFELRRLVGMVFQNPDNQIIGTTVEEDMAFGPENLAIPAIEIRKRIQAALKLLKMENLAKKAPSNLSGGQKQKLAVGSILVMQPKALLLDEATSMLDPDMRRELLAFIRKLRLERSLTVVNVTHHLDELLTADKVLVLVKGHLMRAYCPLDLFNDDEMLSKLKLSLPGGVNLLKALLKAKGINKLDLADLESATIQARIEAELASLTALQANELELMALKLERENEAFIKSLQANLVSLQALSTKDASQAAAKELEPNVATTARETAPDAAMHSPSREAEPVSELKSKQTSEPVIKVRHLTYRYPEASKSAAAVLDDISFDVHKGEILAIVGHSGSGKSTLIMHLNALLKNEPEQVIVKGLDAANKANFLEIRKRVSMLFQYPEHQLFAESIYKDIAYGPTKLGYSADEVKALVQLACDMLGFTPDMFNKSPFELSGGQMRKVALAGIIAMWPDVFVLDEPAAGLDDRGRNEIFNYIKLLKKLGKTIIVVSHNMEDVSEFADRVLIMKAGKLVKIAAPSEIFVEEAFLKANSLEQPALTKALGQASKALDWPLEAYAPTLAKALQNIAQAVKKVREQYAN